MGSDRPGLTGNTKVHRLFHLFSRVINSPKYHAGNGIRVLMQSVPPGGASLAADTLSSPTSCPPDEPSSRLEAPDLDLRLPRELAEAVLYLLTLGAVAPSFGSYPVFGTTSPAADEGSRPLLSKPGILL